MVMAMIFALAITLPATSQTAQADVGDYFSKNLTDPDFYEFTCALGGVVGGMVVIGMSTVVSGGASLVLLIPAVLGVIAAGVLAGCSASVITMTIFIGIGAGVSGLVDGVKMIFSSEEINESYAVHNERGDSEDFQVAFGNLDDTSSDSDGVLGNIGT